MTTGAKIAIGCAVAVVLAVVAVSAVMLGGAFWLKGKAEEFAGEQKTIIDLQQKANANPFTPPADGVMQEARLVKFLDARKRVFAIYEKHASEFEAMSRKKQGDFGDLRQGLALMNEIRLAHARALADVGMSQQEYAYLVGVVYTTLWAAEVDMATGGQSLSEATGDAMDKAAEEMAKAERQSGDDASPEQRKAMRDALEQMREQARSAKEEARKLEVPEENIALFKKYQGDIKKYAMTGLELLSF